MRIKNREARLLRLLDHQFMYGARERILDYASLPLNLYIGGVVQHGDGPPFSAYNNFPAPRKLIQRYPVFVANPEIRNYWYSRGFKNIEVGGSPWAYLLGGINKFCATSLKEGEKPSEVVFFPRHLAIGFEEHSPESIRKRFAFLRNRFEHQKIVCCVYWSDLLDDEWFKLAREYEIEISCAGIAHTDPVWAMSKLRTDFLLKLFNIIYPSQRCLFEDYTSAIIYALSIGKPVQLLNDADRISLGGNLALLSRERQWIKKEIPSIEEDFVLSPMAIDFAKEVCGVPYRKEPNDVHEFFRMFEMQID